MTEEQQLVPDCLISDVRIEWRPEICWNCVWDATRIPRTEVIRWQTGLLACVYMLQRNRTKCGGNVFLRNIPASRRARMKDGLLIRKAERCGSGRYYRVRENNQIPSTDAWTCTRADVCVILNASLRFVTCSIKRNGANLHTTPKQPLRESMIT